MVYGVFYRRFIFHLIPTSRRWTSPNGHHHHLTSSKFTDSIDKEEEKEVGVKEKEDVVEVNIDDTILEEPSEEDVNE